MMPRPACQQHLSQDGSRGRGRGQGQGQGRSSSDTREVRGDLRASSQSPPAAAIDTAQLQQRLESSDRVSCRQVVDWERQGWHRVEQRVMGGGTGLTWRPRPARESASWPMSPSYMVTMTSSKTKAASRNIWSSLDLGADSGAFCAQIRT